MNDYRHTLVLLRHGHSEWNSQNRFTGWIDIGLTATGVAHARRAGTQLREAGFVFDLAVTSVPERATATLTHLQQTLQQPCLPVGIPGG
jgi:2,3-bisphosphoglycerate-dependent phosphoglycerate mutase